MPKKDSPKKIEAAAESEIERLQAKVTETETLATEAIYDLMADRSAYRATIGEAGTVLGLFRSSAGCWCTGRGGKHTARCAAARELVSGIEAMDLEGEDAEMINPFAISEEESEKREEEE